MAKTEKWRDIPGWEGLYQASSKGQIRSLPRKVSGVDAIGREWTRRYPGKLLIQRDLGLGYLTVCLSKDAAYQNYYVHRLVCAAFHGPVPEGHRDAAHWNNKRKDNRPENLRWCSSRENQRDKIRHGTIATRESHGMSKITSEQANLIREARASGATNKQSAERFGISPSQVQRIVAGEHWKEPIT